MRKVVIVGGCAGSKIACNIFELNGVRVMGFIANYVERTGHSWQSMENAAPVLGSILEEVDTLSHYPYFVATGDDYLRQKITNTIFSITGRWPVNAIHPSAVISPYAKLGHGILAAESVVIKSCAVVRNGVVINAQSLISHDNTVCPYAHIACAQLAGYVTVEEYAYVGFGAKVMPNLTVGAGSMIAAGAVVIEDVAPHTMVAGVPAEYKKDWWPDGYSQV